MQWLATLIFISTFIIIYLVDKNRGKAVFPQISFVDYIESNHHWNSWGHWMAQFCIVMAFGMQFTWPLWVYILPSLSFVLIIEFVIQKNSPFDSDVWFDMFTHLAGASNAIVLLAYLRENAVWGAGC